MQARWILHADDLATWFLRLNGCLTMVNFVLHPPTRRGGARGEFDILGVRFPHRREMYAPGAEIEDHPWLHSDGRIDLLIAETTLSSCKLNGPWTQENGRLKYVLRAIGTFQPEILDVVAGDLFHDRSYERNELYRVRVLTFGREEDAALGPNVLQFTWAHVLAFIYDRFDAHRSAKRDHEPWGPVGRALWDLSIDHDREAFVLAGIRELGIDERFATHLQQ
jgi:hypothetical protein